MRILLSNDDGYFAPGLKCLADALGEIADVTVVAPDRNCSGASSSLTLEQPLRYKKTEQGYYSVTGTPTDCVHVGSYRIMDQPPDMVVAGINTGANLGDDVLYSGTVAAAMEGRFLGFPALAVSLVGHDCQHYQSAAQVVVKFIHLLQSKPLQKNRVISINVPDLPIEQIKGFQLTRLGSRHRVNTLVTDTDPKGREILWLGPPADGQDVGEGTDFFAVSSGFVSVTPVQVDLTAYNSFAELEGWMGHL